MPTVTEEVKRTLPLFGIIGTIGGFVADVLQPIAPFSSYIFFSTTLAVITIGIAIFLKSSIRTKGIPALIFSVFLMICSGSLYATQDESNKTSGVLASVLPGINTLQSSLGILQEDLTTIKRSTKKIEETTTQTAEIVKRVEENTEKTVRETQIVSETVKDSTKQIVGSLEEIQKGFSQLTQAGGIIANPTRPEQFYHNARIQEQGGDYGNARRSYNKYITFKLEYLDPHFRYQTFLKVQEGRAGAREIYSIIYENDKRPVIEFSRILLYDPPKRTEMLRNFVKKFPDYSPAYYELSREFSEIRKGKQSLSDKKEELKALNSFNNLRKNGKFLKYFVDKELASKWIDDVESRLKSLSFVSEMKKTSPVKFTASLGSRGWSIRTEVSESVREVFYKLPNDPDFISMGHSQYIDQTTGLAMSNQHFNVPCSGDDGREMCEDVKMDIKIKYIDITKKERGPFTILFHGKRKLDIFCKSMEKEVGENILMFPGCENYGDPNIYCKKLEEDGVNITYHPACENYPQ